MIQKTAQRELCARTQDLRENYVMKSRSFCGISTGRSHPVLCLCFFAGHGIQDGDKIYIVPTRVNPTTPEQLSSQCLSHDELFGMLKGGFDDYDSMQFGNIVYLVIIDVCRTSRKLDGSAGRIFCG